MANFILSSVGKRGTTIITQYDSVKNQNAGLSFDEELDLSSGGNSLSFSMLKYVYEGKNKVVNTLATSLIYGSHLVLNTNGHRYDFNINNISYEFLADNLRINYKATDAFKYELSSIGVGYTISDDTSSADYLGAQPIDLWARKIIRENNLSWKYINIDAANAALIKRDKQSASWNDIVSFSISDSNAYQALATLGENNEFIINVDYASHSFWFVPQKSPVSKGFYFNPWNNLQDFSLSGNSDSLITVLNITGPEDFNGQEITLVPEIPPVIASFINDEINVGRQKLAACLVEGDIPNPNDPSTFQPLFMLSADQTDYTDCVGLDIIEELGNNMWENSRWNNSLYSSIYDILRARDDYQMTSVDYDFLDGSAYTPWLENKLINIEFFKDTAILSVSEYNDIHDILYNKLRIVNGRLILERKNQLLRMEQDLTTLTDMQIALDTRNASILSSVEELLTTIANTDADKAIAPIYLGKEGNTYSFLNLNETEFPEKYEVLVNDEVVAASWQGYDGTSVIAPRKLDVIYV